MLFKGRPAISKDAGLFFVFLRRDSSYNQSSLKYLFWKLFQDVFPHLYQIDEIYKISRLQILYSL